MDTSGMKLADIVRKRRLELGFSTSLVARRSRLGGNKGISSGYVTLIETGQVKNVSPEKLETLAKVLQLTYAELSAAAVGAKPDKDAITHEKLARINFGYEGMPKDKRKKLEPLIDLLEREYERIMNED